MSCSNNCTCKSPCSSPRYTGADIECLGISTNDLMDVAFQQVAEYLCGLSFEDGVGIESISYNEETGELTIILTDASTFVSGDLRGQGVHHVSFTSSTGTPSTTPNQPGEIDTYTVWGDSVESINLGTFTVYNGEDGADGAPGADGTDGVIILHSTHPKDESTGTSIQVLGDPAGYTLVEWGAVASGTIIEMEFDLSSVGAPALTNGLIGFLLNESNVELPARILGDLPIPLPDDDVQALNIKVTLTKNTDTEGFASLVATYVVGGDIPTPTFAHGMSKFVTLATAPAIIERIEVQVQPDSNPITLNRVLIKQINP